MSSPASFLDMFAVSGMSSLLQCALESKQKALGHPQHTHTIVAPMCMTGQADHYNLQGSQLSKNAGGFSSYYACQASSGIVKPKTKAVLCKALKREGSGEVQAALTVKPHHSPADSHKLEVRTTKKWLKPRCAYEEFTKHSTISLDNLIYSNGVLFSLYLKLGLQRAQQLITSH